MTKFLVLDCYDAPGQAELTKAGMTKASTLYRNMLKRINPEFEVDCFDISLHEVDFDITLYDGACWTGSNLFLSEEEPIAKRHMRLCRQFYETGTPQFGSCWGRSSQPILLVQKLASILKGVSLVFRTTLNSPQRGKPTR